MIENLFLSVGAMKAGTTWVYDKLQHHPQIHFSYEKEIYYFSHIDKIANSLSQDKRKRRAERALFAAGRNFKNKKISPNKFREISKWYIDYVSDELNDDWYLQLFDEKKRLGRSVYCADFSNLNCFLDKEGWEHVRSVAKNIKIIYILRDPMSRLWSHYKYHLQFIDHKFANEPEKHFNVFENLLSKPWFLRNSLYAENINRLQKNLNETEFKIYYLEDISSSPHTFFSSIHAFLNIDAHDYKGLELKKRKNRSIKRSMPDEFYEYAKDVLQQETDSLKAMGIWHDDWNI